MYRLTVLLLSPALLRLASSVPDSPPDTSEAGCKSFTSNRGVSVALFAPFFLAMIVPFRPAGSRLLIQVRSETPPALYPGSRKYRPEMEGWDGQRGWFVVSRQATQRDRISENYSPLHPGFAASARTSVRPSPAVVESKRAERGRAGYGLKAIRAGGCSSIHLTCAERRGYRLCGEENGAHVSVT